VVALAKARPVQKPRQIRIDSIFPPRCFRCPERRSVALIQMRYSAASVQDAMTKFSGKLTESVPALKCVGWNWRVNIDPEALQAPRLVMGAVLRATRRSARATPCCELRAAARVPRPLTQNWKNAEVLANFQC